MLVIPAEALVSPAEALVSPAEALVSPAEAGHGSSFPRRRESRAFEGSAQRDGCREHWIPAFAGMTAVWDDGCGG